LGHESTGADDPSAVQIFDRERRGDLVVPRRDVEHLVVPDVAGAMRRVGRAETMVERGLQRGGVVGRKVADGTKGGCPSR